MIAAWVGIEKWARVLLVASIAFGALLIVAALTIPTSSGSQTTETASFMGGKWVTVTSTSQAVSQTLFQENGNVVLYVVSVAICGALIVLCSIIVRRRHGRSGVGVVAWVVIGVLGAVSLVGMPTVGPLIAPVPICLFIAVMRIRDDDRKTALEQASTP